jgi:thiol-disulfide isomerase/thioredoxin
MKKIVLIALVIASCQPTQKISFTTSEAIHENKNEKTLQGIINRNVIEADTTFKWFGNNFKYAQPSTAAIETFNLKKNKFKLIVFGGTWCEDTQNLLPMFYKLVEKSNYPQKKITLVGVNRKKESGNNLSAQYHITKVPAFIVLNNDGNEVGRVVEYGKYNAIDKELAEIVDSIK